MNSDLKTPDLKQWVIDLKVFVSEKNSIFAMEFHSREIHSREISVNTIVIY